ncbi:MAG: hypothetical protein AAGB05_11350 [Pseudomonadota bacterium]
MVLLGALDAEYMVEKQGEGIRVTNTMMKKTAPHPPIGFRVVEVEIGTTRKGEPITSAALTEIEPPKSEDGLAGKPLSPNQKIAFEALRQFMDDCGTPCPGGTGWPEQGSRKVVGQDAFLKFLNGKMRSDNPDSRRRAAQRAVDNLVKKNLVQINEGSLWIIQ